MFVVDIDFYQFGQPRLVVGYEVDVGYCGGYEARLAFAQLDGAAGVDVGLGDAGKQRLRGLACMDFAVAVQTYIYNKGVVLEELAMERAGDVEYLHREIGALGDGYGVVDSVEVVGAVGGVHTEVNSIGCLGCVQLPWTAIEPGAVVVEDSVGDVAVLLDFCQADAATDGMHPSCGDEEHIALLDFVALEHLADGSVLDALLVLILRNRLVES